MNTTEVILITVLVLILLSYFIGKRNGIRDTNKKIVSAGTWIEITDKIKLETGHGWKEKTIKPGTQAIVTKLTNDSEMLIWIAKPWQHLYKDELPYYRIKEFAKIKVISQQYISYDVFADTLNSIEKENDKFLFDYFSQFPNKWFTWQNDIDFN